MRSVADYLGAELDPAAALEIPEVERQADEDSQRWRELYAGSSN